MQRPPPHRTNYELGGYKRAVYVKLTYCILRMNVPASVG